MIPALPFRTSIDKLKNDLQVLINGITDNSATSLSLRIDLQKLTDSVTSTADSEAIARQLLRAFVKNLWGRYLFDIIDQIPNERLRTALAALLQKSEGDFEKFRVAIESWFDDAMDRVSGSYKRHTQWVQLLLEVALTFALNLDLILIVRVLSGDNSGLLKSAVAEAQKFATWATDSNSSRQRVGHHELKSRPGSAHGCKGSVALYLAQLLYTLDKNYRTAFATGTSRFPCSILYNVSEDET